MMKKEKTTEDWLFYIGNVLIIILVIGWPIFLHFANRLSLGCVFQKMTGYQCPACGGTRAFNAMIHGHFLTSLKFNPIVIYFFAFFSWFMLSWYIQKLSGNRVCIGMRFRISYVYIGLAILMIQCTIKNLYIFFS